MQAIITRYFGPTNHRAAKIKATAERGSITISCGHHDPSGVAGHRIAVDALCAKFDQEDYERSGISRELNGWSTWKWIAGGLPQNMRDSYAFVVASKID